MEEVEEHSMVNWNRLFAVLVFVVAVAVAVGNSHYVPVYNSEGWIEKLLILIAEIPVLAVEQDYEPASRDVDLSRKRRRKWIKMKRNNRIKKGEKL